jgi:RNA polymerase sigma factor (sigma-70 family)
VSAALTLADVAAAKSGDRDAFSRIVDATQNAVCSIAYAILRDPDRSEDCAQDVYLSAWQGLSQLKEPASFLPWLRQITRYRAADIQREAIRERSHRVVGDGAEALISAHPDSAPGADTRILDAEDAALLEEALAALDAETREILVLYYREEQSTTAVSGLLDLSEVAVRKRLSRARRELRASALERLALQARRTVPTAALTSAVLAGISMGAPPAATAAAASVAIAKGASGSTGTKVLLALGSSIMAPIVCALAVLYGARSELNRATDETERAAIKRAAAMSIFFTFTAGLGWACHSLWKSDILIIMPYLWLLGGLYWSCMIVNMRGKQMRYARELELEGPIAATRHRSDARARWIGLITGAVIGGATIIVAVIYR